MSDETRGRHDRAVAEALALLQLVKSGWLSEQGRTDLERARKEFYRIEDGLDAALPHIQESE